MGQGSSSSSEISYTNLDFWRAYYDFEAKWEELEREDSDIWESDD